MWYLRQQWLASGRTMDQLWSYVIDGMNFTPSSPAYEDMRDGILAAMPTQAEDCIVWDAFAKFGIGVNADGRQTLFSATVTEDFSKPAMCSGAANTAPTVTITAPANGSSFQQGTAVAFAGYRDRHPGRHDHELAGLDVEHSTGRDYRPAGVVQPVRPDRGNSHDYGVGHRCRRLDRYRDSHDYDYGCSGPDDHADHGRFQSQGCSERESDMDSDRCGIMDVYLGSSIVVVATPNDGAHTYVIGGKGAGSFTFKVCQTGSTTVCSNTSTVNF